MTDDQCVVAVLAWARATLTLGGGYDYEPAQKDQNLPDVVVELRRSELVREHEQFPFFRIQQLDLEVFHLILSFMVDNSNPRAGAVTLRAYAAAIKASIRGDATLGGRVPMASPYFAFDYDHPFVQYDDGTKGREMTLEMWVADPVEQTW